MSTTAPFTPFADKIAEFNLGAAKALHAGGVEAILVQMKMHSDIVAAISADNRRLCEEIARLKDPSRLINEALKRPDVLEAFRHPERVVCSVRKEDDLESFAIGDYVSHDSDLESLLSDRALPSLLAWLLTVAMGQEVVMEVDL